MCSCVVGVQAGLLGHPLSSFEGLLSAPCVAWGMSRSSTGLSQHSDPVFPHFCPLDQNLAHVKTKGGGVS